LRKLGDLLFKRHLLEEVFGVGMRLGEREWEIEEYDSYESDGAGEPMIRERAAHGVVSPPFGSEQVDG
jgi:hypothetical protein